MLEVIAAYDNAENALGFTVYYYITNMESDKLQNTKILKVNDIEASNATIKSGQYPFTNDFYVVIPKNLPQNDPARILYNWIVSEQGKELVERENYVAIDA